MWTCARFGWTEQAHEAAQHTTFAYTDASFALWGDGSSKTSTMAHNLSIGSSQRA